ncbi:MAG: hypothetical protein MJA30_32725, partial [Cytophagales bacterium]|nr:hypothetical protein [Cytophagales bacterium]
MCLGDEASSATKAPKLKELERGLLYYLILPHFYIELTLVASTAALLLSVTIFNTFDHKSLFLPCAFVMCIETFTLTAKHTWDNTRWMFPAYFGDSHGRLSRS